MTAPSYEEVMEHRRGLLLQWEKFHTQAKEMEQLLDGEFLIRTIRKSQAKEPKAYKLGIPATKIQAAIDSLVTNKPTVTREPIGEKKGHKKEADKCEKWGEGVLWELAVSRNMIPPFKSLAGSLFRLGYGVLVPGCDDSVYGEKPSGKGREVRLKWEKGKRFRFPFTMDIPHPARVLLPPLEREPSMAIESQTCKVYDVRRRFPGLDLGDKGLYDLVELIHFWDREWHVICLAGSGERFALPNVYGFVPYCHAYAGYGWEHIPTYAIGESIGTDQADLGPHPEHLARGLLHHARDSIVATNEITNALHEFAMKRIFYVLLTPGDNEGIGRQLAEADLGGIVTTGGEDPTKIVPLQSPDLPPFVFGVDSLYKQDVDLSTTPANVQGFASPNVPTATGQAINLSLARQKYETPLEQLNSMASMALSYFARMLTELGETMTINGVTVNGDDFEGNYKFKVDFMSKDEGARLRASADGREEIKIGARSIETHLQEDAGITDATGEMRKIWLEGAMKTPQVDSAVIALAIKKVMDEAGIPVPTEPGMPTPTPAPGQPPRQAPAGFMPLPGGPQEQGETLRGMTQTPGVGVERLIPTG